MTMITTGWKEYTRGGTRYRIRARYGMDYAFAAQNHQEPYFSLTGDIERKARNGRWVEDSGGTLGAILVKHFPDLRAVEHWHLVSPEGPMHYMANAKYWWEIWHGTERAPEYSRTDPEKAFESTVAWGALASDRDIPATVTWPEMRAELEARLPKLRKQFLSDMKMIGALGE